MIFFSIVALRFDHRIFESRGIYAYFFAVEVNGGLPIRAKERPSWALFGKVNQNMETVLFKEKFVDWPDSTRLIKVKGQTSDGEAKV